MPWVSVSVASSCSQTPARDRRRCSSLCSGTSAKVSSSSFRSSSRLHCANGVHIKEGTISVRKAGNQDSAGVEFLFYKFQTITITSVQEAGDTNDIPLDSVSFAFQKIDVMYKPQTATGGVGSAVEVAWDLSAKKI